MLKYEPDCPRQMFTATGQQPVYSKSSKERENLMFKSLLKTPDNAIMIGLAEAAAVYVIYQSAVPAHVDIRAADAHNTDVEASRKAAAWNPTPVLGTVVLVTRDLTSFMLGSVPRAAR